MQFGCPPAIPLEGIPVRVVIQSEDSLGAFMSDHGGE